MPTSSSIFLQQGTMPQYGAEIFMRILYLTSVDATGADAPAVHVRGTCQALSEAGHQVALAHAVPLLGRELRADWLDRSDRLVWPTIRGGWRIFQLMVALKLPSIINDWRPDLIYARIAPGWTIIRILERISIPLVLEVNGVEGLAGAKFERLARVSRLILVDHPRLADRISQIFPKQTKKIREHDTFVTDGSIFFSRDRSECCNRLGFRHGVFRAIHVSSFQRWHDFETIFRALSKVAEETDHDIELILMGEGGCRAEVQQMASHYSGRVQVIFPGRIAHDTVAEYIGASDLALDLLTYAKLAEGKNLGAYKVYEYAACDRPVITAVTSDFVSPKWAEKGFFLIPPEDPEALAEAIRAVINDPEAALARARIAGEFVRREKTWQVATATTLVHLREAIPENEPHIYRG